MVIYKLKLRYHTFLSCWLLPLSSSLCVLYTFGWKTFGKLKICHQGFLRHALSCLFDSFVDHFEQVYTQRIKSAVRLYFVVLVCLSFSWGQHYSVLALNIVDSPTLVFIPILPYQFEQVLPNLSTFHLSTFLQAFGNYSNHCNLSNIHEVFFESLIPNLVAFWLCLFARNEINSICIHI